MTPALSSPGLSADAAREAVDEVAARLRTPEAVAACGARADSLAAGHPGVSLLFTTLAADRGGDARTVAHGHLAAATRADGGLHAAGLYTGMAAVAFAARLAATGPDAYRSLLTTLTPRIADAAVQRARHLRTARSAGTGVASHQYDVVSGVAGLARLLLALDPRGPALRHCLQALTDLTEPAATGQGTLPGWWSAGGPGRDTPPSDYPRGHLNLGLAHGIPGPLAVLALALEQGVRVPGQEEAITRLAGWLVQRRSEDAYGPYWAMVVRPEDELAGVLPPSPPTRAAWCYGSPGVARALFLAGRALGEPAWRGTAARSLHAALARPAATRALEGAGLCHGTGGLLHIAALVAYEAADEELTARLPALAAEVRAGLDALEGPGFLEGAAGAALALHTYAQRPDAAQLSWDAALLTS
ncbi:lanthionine synthetase C family protein [Streptomyces sp. TLI_146]|uniref:lanthionine synthetase C family protein n=1 Tax=Streptomyces sp. TLI_146 TaxID=1938858 RepID=UPI000C6FE55B|nr:lanthionine synthetase C family protein [Streptomyces sp. TLI_146]PKV89744.1 lanthionine synthetase-like protein [Streptomyces sp. TLI_146]